MSLTTRCSACDTLFKVVDDQLKISQGWVRCGQCAHVFDARANGVEQAPNPELADASQLSTSQSKPAPASVVSNDAASSKDPLALSESVPAFTSSRGLDSSARADDNSQPSLGAPADQKLASISPNSQSIKQTPWRFRPAHDSALDAGPTSTNWSPSELSDALDSPLGLHANEGPLSGAGVHEAVLPGISAAMPVGSESQAHTLPSFLKDAQRARRWRSPWVRAVLSLTGIFLLLGLLTQIAIYERDELAAMYPKASPYLQRLCEISGCTIAPLRRIESIMVEDSSFKSQSSDELPQLRYLLSVSLKNIGAVALALPHIELSLHNGQDQVILRRVLSPSELQVKQAQFAPRSELTAGASIEIQTSALAGQSIQGYRVLAFYP